MPEPELDMLPDGTTLRWTYMQQGEYSDVEIRTVVKNGRIQFQGDSRSPYGATRDFDQLIRGEEVGHGRDHPYEEWEWNSGDGWKPISNLIEG